MKQLFKVYQPNISLLVPVNSSLTMYCPRYRFLLPYLLVRSTIEDLNRNHGLNCNRLGGIG